MGYWGWRPLVLILCISVWVTGCMPTREIAPTTSPTNLPPVTLMLRSRSTLTPSPTYGLPNQASPQATLVSTIEDFTSVPSLFPHSMTLSYHPTPTPQPLMLQSPTCYEILTGGVICLGTVENSISEPLERVTLMIELLGKNGTPLITHETLLEQRVIMPGQAAPYRVLFTPENASSLVEQYGGVSATLRRADRINSSRMTLLDVENAQAEVDAGRYRISADIFNPNQVDSLALRVVATVYDEAGRVTGYRVISAGSLAAGERLPITVEIVPQSPPIDNRVPHYTLHAEAQQSGQ